MKRADLKVIVAGVLEMDPALLSADTDLKTIPTFDSVAVLTLIVELDEKAGIKLQPADTQSLRLYGDIEKLAARQAVELTD